MTIALIAIAWIGFFVAVIGGILAGLIIIVIGFIACWLVVATFAGKKKGDDERQSEPLLRGGDVETDDDVQSRVRNASKRSVRPNQPTPRDTADGEDA